MFYVFWASFAVAALLFAAPVIVTLVRNLRDRKQSLAVIDAVIVAGQDSEGSSRNHSEFFDGSDTVMGANVFNPVDGWDHYVRHEILFKSED